MTKKSNILARYVWLLDTLHVHGPLSYVEINKLWIDSGLNCGDKLPLRTFHNHRQSIADVFGIDISCRVRGKDSVYYIEDADNLADGSFKSWIYESISALNAVSNAADLESRIAFEHVPSALKWLPLVVEAMHIGKMLIVDYRRYAESGTTMTRNLTLAPFGLRLFNRRWYVVGKQPESDKIWSYALDRMICVKLSDKSFDMPEDFDINQWFKDCYGIIRNVDIPAERVVIKVFGLARNYLTDLPLHHTQKMIARDEDSITLEYNLKPTYDFKVALLQQADQVEVLKPSWFREELKDCITQMQKRYK